jgi:hypothetical protein
VIASIAAALVALLLRSPLVAARRSRRVRLRLGDAAPPRAIDRRSSGADQPELYTVNHLLAMHVRTGAGPMQAAARRGGPRRRRRRARRGAHLDAERTSEPMPSAAAELTLSRTRRTYQLLAAGAERGVDLGASLLALSADIRDARREQLHKDAVRRRAAMLVPTIAILAPIMLLFIAAPLPSIVLGHH